MVGDTTVEVPVKAPGFHVYDVAPVAVNVPELPMQIVFDEAVNVNEGTGFTIIFTVCVLVHPKPLSLVTVYIVVEVGETTVVEPVNAPGVHVYVEPPLAVNVAVLPEQIVFDVALAVIVGFGTTVIASVFVLVHPEIFEPVTV